MREGVGPQVWEADRPQVLDWLVQGGGREEAARIKLLNMPFVSSGL